MEIGAGKGLSLFCILRISMVGNSKEGVCSGLIHSATTGDTVVVSNESLMYTGHCNTSRPNTVAVPFLRADHAASMNAGDLLGNSKEYVCSELIHRATTQRNGSAAH